MIGGFVFVSRIIQKELIWRRDSSPLFDGGNAARFTSYLHELNSEMRRDVPWKLIRDSDTLLGLVRRAEEISSLAC